MIIESNPNSGLTARQRYVAMAVLIFSGEAIFFLPFVLPRVFRPTFLAVFDISNLQLGTLYTAYGLVAIGAYLLGGPLADRYPPNRLMALALGSTALGGLFAATIPPHGMMLYLYAFWGITTILLFWAALMRSTRILGGEGRQGLAFGLLDGGRGLVAAIIGSAAVWVLAFFLPVDHADLSMATREGAFQKVIYFFCAFVFLIAIVINWALKGIYQGGERAERVLTWARIKEVMMLPTVWLQAIIIICAYSGYRVADDFSLLAQDMLGYDEVDSAWVGSVSLWLRPLAAIGAGLLADRFSSSKMIAICFGLLTMAGLSMGFGLGQIGAEMLFVLVIVSTCLGVYALRGLYFAIMEEGEIPVHVTGTAVGLASIVGYLPDVYMGPLTGYILDANPGLDGHRYIFIVMACFSVIGLLTVFLFRKVVSKNKSIA